MWALFQKGFNVKVAGRKLAGQPQYMDEYTEDFEQYYFGTNKDARNYAKFINAALVLGLERVSNELGAAHFIRTGDIPEDIRTYRFKGGTLGAAAYMLGGWTPGVGQSQLQIDHLLLKSLNNEIKNQGKDR